MICNASALACLHQRRGTFLPLALLPLSVPRTPRHLWCEMYKTHPRQLLDRADGYGATGRRS